MNEPVSVGGGGGGGGSARKRGKRGFGTNLNRLAGKPSGPAAPPVSSITIGGNSRSSVKARGVASTGLLLLSAKTNKAAAAAPGRGGAAPSGNGAPAPALSRSAAAAVEAAIPGLLRSGGGGGGVGGGIASPIYLTSTALSSTARPSAHDALLTAAAAEAAGTDRSAGPSASERDAWGVQSAEKKKLQQREVEDKRVYYGRSPGGGERAAVAPLPQVLAPRGGRAPSDFPRAAPGPGVGPAGGDPEARQKDQPQGRLRTRQRSGPSGEGGEGNLAAATDCGETNQQQPQSPPNGDGVKEAMTKLAKERAERRRDEEEKRVRDQKEGAARRLRELEEKMSISTLPVGKASASSERRRGVATDLITSSGTAAASPRDVLSVITAGGDRSSSRPAPSGGSGSDRRLVLERLGKTKQGGGGGQRSDRVDATERGVGSGGPSCWASAPKGGGADDRSPQGATETAAATGRRGEPQQVVWNRGARRNGNGNGNVGGSPRLSGMEIAVTSHRGSGCGAPPPLVVGGAIEPPPPPQTIIQLSSYEACDRGEGMSGGWAVGTSSGQPRMLFDPKSGSMVAAPGPREDRGGGGSGGGGGGGGGTHHRLPSDGGRRERDNGRKKDQRGGGDRDRVPSKGGGGSDRRISRDRDFPAVLLARRPDRPSAPEWRCGPSEEGPSAVRGRGAPLSSSGGGGGGRGGRRRDDRDPPRTPHKDRDGVGGGRDRSSSASETHRRGGTGLLCAGPSSQNEAGGTPRRGGGGRVVARADNRRPGAAPGATAPPSSQRQRLPRTCGVLYRRDPRGNIVCADGCDGPDGGVGAHTVPGGKVRNPEAHGSLMAQIRKARAEELAVATVIGRSDAAQSAPVGQPYYSNQGGRGRSGSGSDVPSEQHPQSLHRGFGFDPGFDEPYEAGYDDGRMLMQYPSEYYSLDIPRGVDDFFAVTLEDPEPELEPEREPQPEISNYEIPFVKANEAIELLVGTDEADESPTLQATAAAWAPSEAALAAAAYAASAASHGTASTDGSQDALVGGKGTPEMIGLEREGSVACNRSVHDIDLDMDMGDHVATAAAGLIINDDDEDDGLSALRYVNNFNKNQSLLGLGFDPTEDMDAMMMSPDQGPFKYSAATNEISNLSLDAPTAIANVKQADIVTNASNPFVSLRAPSTPSKLLGSGTWGTGGSLGVARLGGSPLGSLPISSVPSWGDFMAAGSGTCVDKSNKLGSDAGNDEPKVASFLSLSSFGENMWGTGPIGFTRLGGASSFGSARSGAEK